MREFKPGDRVYVPVATNKYWAGDGIVESIFPYSAVFGHVGSLLVKMASGRMAGFAGGFAADSVVLLEKAPEKEYVVVVTTTPYPTREAAERYAKSFTLYTAEVVERDKA